PLLPLDAGGGRARPLVRIHPRLLDRLLGLLRLFPDRQWPRDHGWLPPSLGAQDVRSSLDAAPVLHDLPIHVPAEQRIRLVQRPPNASPQRRRRRTRPLFDQTRLLV